MARPTDDRCGASPDHGLARSIERRGGPERRRAIGRAAAPPALGLVLALLLVAGVPVGGTAVAQPSPTAPGATPTSTTAVPPPTSAPSTVPGPDPTTGDSSSTTGVAPTTTSGPATTDRPAPTSSVPVPTTPPPVSTTEVVGRPTDATLPPGPPDGFTQEQYRTFVDVVTACGTDPGAVCTWVLGWSGSEVAAEAAQWATDVPVRIAMVAAGALAANWLVRRAIGRYMRTLERRAGAANGTEQDHDTRRLLRMTTASASIASAATVAIFTVAAFVGLAQLDIDLGPLIAGAGVVGVALGFGAQNVVRDVLAGLFVLAEDQYGIGDVIDAGRAEGVVEGISLRITKVRDIEGTLWFVPNGIVKEVGNKTQRWSRVILDVGVAYGADHHEAARLIKESADSLWRDPDRAGDILEEPELWGVEELGDSSVAIRVAVKSAPADQWRVARELRSRIKDRFDDAGIEIPFPQQTVWVRSDAERAVGADA